MALANEAISSGLIPVLAKAQGDRHGRVGFVSKRSWENRKRKLVGVRFVTRNGTIAYGMSYHRSFLSLHTEFSAEELKPRR